MYISSVTLNNFRNYEYAKIELSPFTNVIYGDNAQGKTNILEAIYIFSHGKSHHSKSDRELIRFKESFAKLSIEFHDSERSYNAFMQLNRGGKKSIKINHVQITKLSMLMSYLNVVMFSPEDLDLVKGSPGARRRFIDAAISQLYPGYLASLIDYHKALNQKNSLLKALKASGKKSDITLSVWNEQLAAEGAKIMSFRNDFVDLLNSFASAIQSEISGEALNVAYVPSIKCGDISEESLYEYLENNQRREIEFASALLGIQRDDLSIFINGNEARAYGSQGQQRTAALSMKIAQADYIHHVRGEYPVLLLDDIMSELDINRRMYLSKKIRDKQVLITCTDTDLIESTPETKLFHVRNGTIE
ncbi:MAG: DNA replication/repair protein RecF [Oscillospiraceae bacterium]|nr:DNA replication/repair protein RecF [Oscillospiraceae bacterium]